MTNREFSNLLDDLDRVRTEISSMERYITMERYHEFDIMLARVLEELEAMRASLEDAYNEGCNGENSMHTAAYALSIDLSEGV